MLTEIKGLLYRFKGGSVVRPAILDFLRAIHDFPSTCRQALLDIEQRYRRSLLGPFWLIIGTIALAGGYTTLGSQIFSINSENFLLYVLAGIAGWQFISACTTDATSMFVVEYAAMLSGRPSLCSFALRVVLRHMLVLGHSLPVIVVIAALNGDLNPQIAWFVPAMMAVGSVMAMIVLVVGLISTRLRDFAQLVLVFMQFAIFLTPVFWLTDNVQVGTFGYWILQLNPFTHMIEVLRAPLIGRAIDPAQWLAVGMVGVVSFAAVALVFPIWRGRIAFWL